MNKVKKVLKISMVCLSFFISFLFLYTLFKANMVPNHYLIIVAFITFIILIILSFMLISKKRKRYLKIMAFVLLLIFSIVMTVGQIYLTRTNLFLDRINNIDSHYEEFYLLTLKKDDISLKKMNDKKIGTGLIANNVNLKSAISKLKEQIQFTIVEFGDYREMMDKLKNGEIDAILINESIKLWLYEELGYTENDFTKIISIAIKIKVNDVSKETNVASLPFTIYLIGSDSFGSIKRVSNSDVNILITVNPVREEILLTSIPRDYYVQLYHTEGKEKDKLTHAGYYGIETSVKTMESLLNTKINYYAKVNFSTLVKLVDMIDGIDVELENKVTIIDYKGTVYKFEKGINHLDGMKALALARERKNFKAGDRSRQFNQQKILSAIIKKTTSSSVLIKKYFEILSAVEQSFEINMSSSSISKLIKFQLDYMPTWEIKNQTVDGTDAYKQTYSFPKQLLYVMEPDEQSVKLAQDEISRMMEVEDE